MCRLEDLSPVVLPCTRPSRGACVHDCLHRGRGGLARPGPRIGGDDTMMAMEERAAWECGRLTRRPLWLVGLLIATVLASLAVRWVFLVRDYAIPDADQSVIGLMAHHILLGERPLFFWGQPYTGSIDAYVTAVLFALFGRHDLLLHIAPLTASLLFVLLTVVLAYRLAGFGVALLSALYLALAPTLLITWSLWAGSGYLEVMALGTGAFLLALPSYTGMPERGIWRLPAAYFLLGVAFWLQPIAVYYVLALLALRAGPARAAWQSPAARARVLGGAVACIAGFLLGTAPLLVYNLQHQWATMSYLANRGNHLDYLTVLLRTAIWTGPVVVGTMPATTSVSYFTAFIQAHLPAYAVGLAVEVGIAARVLALRDALLVRLRTLASPRPAPDAALLVLTVVNVLAFLSSSWGAEQWSSTQPRYLLPLYGVTPLLIRGALPAVPRWRHWLAVSALLLGLCAINLYVDSTAFPRPDLQPLAALLESHRIAVIYGDYWTVYPVMYVSNERIIGIAVRDDLGNLHNNRYSPYLRLAAASRHLAWVVQIGSTLQTSLLQCFATLHSTYGVLTWEDQRIYTLPTGGAFPWWNGGRCLLAS